MARVVGQDLGKAGMLVWWGPVLQVGGPQTCRAPKKIIQGLFCTSQLASRPLKWKQLALRTALQASNHMVVVMLLPMGMCFLQRHAVAGLTNFFP